MRDILRRPCLNLCAADVRQERGLGGAVEAASDKVVATVGSVKDIPPFLETEARALMLKVPLPLLPSPALPIPCPQAPHAHL